jgi:hypothetical protein
MELVIGLIVLVIAGVFIFRPKKEAEAAPVAEYKVETPTPVAEQATQAVVESIVPAKKKPAAKKAPAAKKTAARKPKAK